MSTLKTHRFSAHQVSVSCSAGGEQQSDATPQVARGWARSPCRPLQEPILLLRWVCFRGGGLPNPDLARVEGGGGAAGAARRFVGSVDHHPLDAARQPGCSRGPLRGLLRGGELGEGLFCPVTLLPRGAS
jgi:hypothetical protein